MLTFISPNNCAIKIESIIKQNASLHSVLLLFIGFIYHAMSEYNENIN